MKNRYLLWSALACILVLTATLLIYPRLPQTIPTHWNALGEIDGHGPRAWIFALPLLQVVLCALWLVLPGVSPARFEVDRFSDSYWYGGLVLAALLGYIQAVILWGVGGGGLDMGRASYGGIGLAFVLLGNVLGKVRRNFWLGVRTPWTLASERVWYATHRLAAKTMVAGGLLAMAATLAGLPAFVATALLLAAALVPAAYSLVYYRRQQRSGSA